MPRKWKAKEGAQGIATHAAWKFERQPTVQDDDAVVNHQTNVASESSSQSKRHEQTGWESDDSSGSDGSVQGTRQQALAGAPKRGSMFFRLFKKELEQEQQLESNGHAANRKRKKHKESMISSGVAMSALNGQNTRHLDSVAWRHSMHHGSVVDDSIARTLITRYKEKKLADEEQDDEDVPSDESESSGDEFTKRRQKIAKALNMMGSEAIKVPVTKEQREASRNPKTAPRSEYGIRLRVEDTSKVFDFDYTFWSRSDATRGLSEGQVDFNGANLYQRAFSTISLLKRQRYFGKRFIAQSSGISETSYYQGGGCMIWPCTANTTLDGVLYMGLWGKGKMQAYGELHYACGDIYRGQVKDSQIHGYGVMHYRSLVDDTCGDVYEGTYVHSLKEGVGRYSFTSADSVYEGNFQKGKFHGWGRFQSPNEMFLCQWIDDTQNGIGIHRVLSSGKSHDKSYIGEYKDGRRHGRGTLVMSDGSIYVGEFEHGRLHGYGKLSTSSGMVLMGSWFQGLRHGKIALTRADKPTERMTLEYHYGDILSRRPYKVRADYLEVDTRVIETVSDATDCCKRIQEVAPENVKQVLNRLTQTYQACEDAVESSSLALHEAKFQGLQHSKFRSIFSVDPRDIQRTKQHGQLYWIFKKDYDPTQDEGADDEMDGANGAFSKMIKLYQIGKPVGANEIRKKKEVVNVNVVEEEVDDFAHVTGKIHSRKSFNLASTRDVNEFILKLNDKNAVKQYDRGAIARAHFGSRWLSSQSFVHLLQGVKEKADVISVAKAMFKRCLELYNVVDEVTSRIQECDESSVSLVHRIKEWAEYKNLQDNEMEEELQDFLLRRESRDHQEKEPNITKALGKDHEEAIKNALG